MSLTAMSGGANASVPENARMTGAQRATLPPSGEPASSIGLPAPMPHANRVGVAAYLAVMNPAPAASMRTEA